MRVNVTTILLCCVTAMQMRRACYPGAGNAWGRESMEVIKVTCRRAAA